MADIELAKIIKISNACPYVRIDGFILFLVLIRWFIIVKIQCGLIKSPIFFEKIAISKI
jgi:hypothetical protein